MNEDHDLLVRIDERTEATHDWILEHKELHEKEKAARHRWNLAAFSLIGGVIVKMLFWK